MPRTCLPVSRGGDPCTIPQRSSQSMTQRHQHHRGHMGNAHSRLSPDLLQQNPVDPLVTSTGPPGCLMLLRFGNHCPSILEALSGGISLLRAKSKRLFIPLCRIMAKVLCLGSALQLAVSPSTPRDS